MGVRVSGASRAARVERERERMGCGTILFTAIFAKFVSSLDMRKEATCGAQTRGRGAAEREGRYGGGVLES
eukprot:4931280-Prymnesium_polylepis.2